MDLLACGLFKLGVFPYMGGAICEKALFSVKGGGEKRALDVFSLGSVEGGGGGGVIRVR